MNAIMTTMTDAKFAKLLIDICNTAESQRRQCQENGQSGAVISLAFIEVASQSLIEEWAARQGKVYR